MASVESFYKIRRPIIVFCKYVGAEVLTSDKWFHPMSYVLMFHMVAFNVCNFYTMIQIGSDVKQLMKTTIIVGIANQLIFKFFSLLAERRKLRSLFELAEERLYRQYQDGSQQEKEIVAKTNRFLEVFWKALLALYGSTMFVFGLWPVYVYYKDGELVPLFMYYIPMVSLESTTGYLVTMAFHIDCYTYGIVGCFLTEYAFIFLSMHALVSVDLFLLHLKELGVLLRSPREEETEDAIEQKWTSCVIDHQFCTE
ncbi:Odorant receptor 83c [Culex quinquefasciatus]|uniref:Odorant receptor 83c n=1 Tax=Culex quinquefasciatus TaxID=7176 RepID=B0WGD6_CULQU|nr:Odorant receptor 83c [Culex quinquefasciatus]|eukprot:XP_001847770.1 Odorant receptor 83c [Culex quinquefasciatus]